MLFNRICVALKRAVFGEISVALKRAVFLVLIPEKDRLFLFTPEDSGNRPCQFKS